MWTRITALVIKELLALLRDKRSRMVLVGPPIIQMVVFGYAATYDLNNVPFAVYDEDDSAASRELLSGFRGSPTFQEVATLTHQEQIAPLVNDGKVLLVLHVDRRFGRDLASGRQGRFQVIVDGRDSNTATLALGYVGTIVERFDREWIARRGGPGPPARLQIRAWFNENLQSRWFIVPGMVGLLSLVVTMVVTALSVAREREQGTFDQLLVTPLRPIEILAGKALPGVLVGTVEGTFILLVGVLWFSVPLRGSLASLYAGLGLFLFSAIGIGLMISSLAVTMQQGMIGAFVFLAPAVILSGFTTPIENMPRAVQLITLANPLRYFIVILRGVFLEGAPFDVLMSQLWPLALIGVVCLAASGWLFRHRLY